MESQNKGQSLKGDIKEEEIDPLLESILIIARLNNISTSRDAILAGLPRDEPKLNLKLLTRAAKNAKLDVRLVKRRLSKVPSLGLPAILLLKNDKLLILKEVYDSKFIVIEPKNPHIPVDYLYEDIEADYKGYAVIVKPQMRLRHQKEKIEGKNWFYQIVIKQWSTYSEVLLATFLINCFALATPFFIMNVYDRVVSHNAFSTLWALTIGMMIVFIFDFVMRGLRAYFIDSSSRSTDALILTEVYEHLLDIKASSRPPAGVLANTVLAFESFKDFVTSSTISSIADLPFIVVFLIAIFWVGGWLVYVPLLVLPLILIVSYFNQSQINRLVGRSIQLAAEKQTVLMESLEYIETIKTMRSEGPLQRRWESIVKNASNLALKIRFFTNFGINFSIFMQYAATAAMVVAGVYKIAANSLTLGGLIACTILAGRVLAPIIQFASFISRYKQFRVSLQLIEKTLELPLERPFAKTFLHHHPLRGDIELVNVSFAYPNSSIAALNNVNLKINQGEHVGILGLSGSGKTTIFKLLLKLFEPKEGNILIDKMEMSQLDPVDLRRYIGYLPQDVFLLSGSIKDNIKICAPYVDDNQILRAAEISGIVNFVNTHPEGFDRQVGDRGQFLSTGQRQGVGIARAIIHEPNIFLLDEPTSSMDDNSTLHFIKEFQKIIAGKTTIMITHKKDLMPLIDRLIVLHNGRIVADGPRDIVLDKLAKKV